MNYSLHKNLETTTRFMYQKRNDSDFSYFDSLIGKITDDVMSDFPDLQKKREELYSNFFRENNIPEITINGKLITDFNLIQKMARLYSDGQTSFISPKSDTKKISFSDIESESKDNILEEIHTMSDTLKKLVFEALEKKSEPNNESLSSLNFFYYPKIQNTLRKFNTSCGKVAAIYQDPRFAIPKLYETNGISYYRDEKGNILDFPSIVTKSKSITALKRN